MASRPGIEFIGSRASLILRSPKKAGVKRPPDLVLALTGNVVFISDACRSLADSLRAERVQGTVVFPSNGSNANVISDVDQFLATRVGAAAYEVAVTESAAAFEARVESALDSFFVRHAQGDTVVVTHGGVIQIALHRIVGRPSRGLFPFRISNSSITLISKRDGHLIIDSVNDTGHLEGAAHLAD